MVPYQASWLPLTSHQPYISCQTNFTPNVFIWLSEGLKQSHFARDDLIVFIVAQNILFASLAIAWIAMYGRGHICHRKSSHAYLDTTTQPLAEPIIIHVTKVVTVKTEEISTRALRRIESLMDSASLASTESVELFSDRTEVSKWPFCDV